jgi:hypothetical protein
MSIFNVGIIFFDLSDLKKRVVVRYPSFFHITSLIPFLHPSNGQLRTIRGVWRGLGGWLLGTCSGTNSGWAAVAFARVGLYVRL